MAEAVQVRGDFSEQTGLICQQILRFLSIKWLQACSIERDFQPFQCLNLSEVRDCFRNVTKKASNVGLA